MRWIILIDQSSARRWATRQPPGTEQRLTLWPGNTSTCTVTPLPVLLHIHLYCYASTCTVTPPPVLLHLYLYCYTSTCTVTPLPVLLHLYLYCYTSTVLLRIHLYCYTSTCTVTAHFHRGRERCVTAASRSPLLIAATLVNESISTGRRGASQQRPRSGAPPPQRYLYVAFHFRREPLLNRVNLKVPYYAPFPQIKIVPRCVKDMFLTCFGQSCLWIKYCRSLFIT